MKNLKRIISKCKIYKYFKKKVILLMYYLPVNSKKIVFDNFGGRGYGDDPKYIAEELRKGYPELKLIWLTSKMNIELPKEIKPVKYGTIRAAYHLSTARIWIDNIKSSIKVKKKPNQYYIQTWHSTLGFKMNEQDAEFLPSKYVEEAKKDAARTDLMYSNNDFRIDKYKRRYWYSGPVIKCDVPRMGILYNCPKELRRKVYSKYSIADNKKIVLYAPTFRKNSNLELYKIEYESIISTLEDKFDTEFVMFIRLHPNEADRSKEFIREDNVKVFDVSVYPDMQELLAIADILITDYSGCMFDFGLVNKPVFLLAKDFEDYCKFERKMYFSISDLPFSLAINEKQLHDNIKNFEENQYRLKCNLFKDEIGYEDNGSGAIEIVQQIIEVIEKGKKV